jgi:hypothetical protein
LEVRDLPWGAEMLVCTFCAVEQARTAAIATKGFLKTLSQEDYQKWQDNLSTLS